MNFVIKIEIKILIIWSVFITITKFHMQLKSNLFFLLLSQKNNRKE